MKAIVDNECVRGMASAPAFAASCVQVNFHQWLASSEVLHDAMPSDSMLFLVAHVILCFQKNSNTVFKSHCNFDFNLVEFQRGHAEIHRGVVLRQRFTLLEDARQARLTSANVYAGTSAYGRRQRLQLLYLPLHPTTSPSLPRLSILSQLATRRGSLQHAHAASIALPDDGYGAILPCHRAPQRWQT